MVHVPVEHSISPTAEIASSNEIRTFRRKWLFDQRGRGILYAMEPNSATLDNVDDCSGVKPPSGKKGT